MGVNGDVKTPSPAAALRRLQTDASPEDHLEAIAVVRDRLTPGAAAALQRLAVARERSPLVRAAAIAALASQGKAITVEPRAPMAVRSAARKAAAMLATRDLVTAADRGDPSVRLPKASSSPAPPAAMAIQAVPLPTAERRRVVAASTLPRPLAENVQGLRCNGRELAVIARPEHLEPGRLGKAPARPAQIALHHTDEIDEWTAPFDVLTSPRGRRTLKIVVVDWLGEPRFIGTGTIAADSVGFELHAAEHPGAVPVTVRGHAAAGRLVLDELHTSVRSLPPRAPTPVRPTDTGPEQGPLPS
jgi:hypothetical protein